MSHYKPDPNKSVNLNIDGIPVTVPEGTTILEAARKINVQIPTLCDHPDLRRRAVCRLCVVECDGRGKLVAACANDVWEGVNVVTNNARLVGIRKTIIELMLANHPQDCIGCVKNTKCELQSLAARFGIRASPFHRETVKHETSQKIHTRQENHTRQKIHTPNAISPQREIAGGTLVRDMEKCVKCGRCVETCQKIHTVRAINTSHRSVNYEINTPYGQALEHSPCVFCGECAEVCPVGAIHAHDQTAEIWAALNSGKQLVAQLSPSTASALSAEFNLPSESITVGKITTTLKMLGFSHVYDACIFRDTTINEQISEFTMRYKNSYRLPMISCCSQSAVKFVKEFYPDLVDRLYAGKSPHQIFAAFAKEKNPEDVDVSKIIHVSITSCIAAKFEIQQSWLSRLLVNAFDKDQNVDFALTTGELARMIRTAGIDIKNLPEGPFDSPGDASTENINTPTILTVNGLANARKIMDSIRMGKCDASFVRILCCRDGCPDDNRVFNEVLKT
jgi:NADH dehydrogenase/NADH:ubiquinone oxidoreductase subunit G